jgi:hypothetical protein
MGGKKVFIKAVDTKSFLIKGQDNEPLKELKSGKPSFTLIK